MMFSNNIKCFNLFIFIIILLWIFSGVFSFILSTIFLKNKSNICNIFKLFILSIIFGPLYLLLYLYIDNYYLKKPLYRFKKK